MIEKAIDTLVYAPVGVAMFMRDSAPTFLPVFIARGRGEVESKVKGVEDAFSHARTRGEATIAFGPLSLVSDLVSRLDALRNRFTTTVQQAAPSRARTEPAASPAPAAGNGNGTAPREERAPIERPDASRLAIANYDELSASQVVERLDGLDVKDLEAIREYEEKTRGRRTILGRIEVLTA